MPRTLTIKARLGRLEGHWCKPAVPGRADVWFERQAQCLATHIDLAIDGGQHVGAAIEAWLAEAAGRRTGLHAPGLWDDIRHNALATIANRPAVVEDAYGGGGPIEELPPESLTRTRLDSARRNWERAKEHSDVACGLLGEAPRDWSVDWPAYYARCVPDPPPRPAQRPWSPPRPVYSDAPSSIQEAMERNEELARWEASLGETTVVDPADEPEGWA